MTIDEMKQVALAIKEAFAGENLAVDDDRLCRAVVDINKSALYR